MVEMTDGERALDPVTRAASALGRVARPGLSKAWSVSSPNMAQLGAHTGTPHTSHVTIVTCHTLHNISTADTDTVDILERIRDLEEQIAGQQVSEFSQLRHFDKWEFKHSM